MTSGRQLNKVLANSGENGNMTGVLRTVQGKSEKVGARDDEKKATGKTKG